MEAQWHELLMADHQVADRALAATSQALDAPGGPPAELVAHAVDFFATYVDSCHNQKEQQHLFPLLERLGVPRAGGPLGMMLAEHDQSHSLIDHWRPLAEAYVRGDRSVLDKLRAQFRAYAELVQQHFWKENDILYPIAMRVMGAAEGAEVVAGIHAVEARLGADTRERYYRVAEELIALGEVGDLSLGVERSVLGAILNTLPVELSFVDADDRVRYFSHERGTKIFPRTRGVIGMPVQQCHPQKSVHVVNRILADFKAGRREVAEFWIGLGGKKIHIRYFPVRDPAGHYLGCLEVVQDITRVASLAGERRLLDDG